MAGGEELLARMRASKTGWRHSDLDRLYLAFGFECKESGKHSLYVHSQHPDLRATVTRGAKLKIGYVAHAVKLVTALLARQQGAK